ncbi:MAG: PilZ domain-containing protein [Chloroflexota bacterium]
MKKKEKKQDERRSIPRIKISYYVPVIESEKLETLGILSDISTKGLLVNSQKNLPVDQQVKLRLDLSDDGFEHPFINFNAQVINVRPDPYGPGYYNIGFEILDLSIANFRIIEKIMEKYAA